MKAETAKLAKRFNWWWRNCDDFTLLPNGQTRKNGTAMSHFWKGGNETAAFAYELVRRAHRSRRLPAYPELTAEQQGTLRGAAGADQHYWIMQESTMPYHEQMACPGWTAAVQWNLHASDSALLKSFTQWIHSERKRKGCLRKKLPAKNTPSWRWLEVWDENELAGLALGTSESSMKSKAKKAAKRAEKAVLAALSRGSRKKSFRHQSQ